MQAAWLCSPATGHHPCLLQPSVLYSACLHPCVYTPDSQLLNRFISIENGLAAGNHWLLSWQPPFQLPALPLPQWDDIPDALPGSSAVVRNFGGPSQPSSGGASGGSPSSSCTDKEPNGGWWPGAVDAVLATPQAAAGLWRLLVAPLLTPLPPLFRLARLLGRSAGGSAACAHTHLPPPIPPTPSAPASFPSRRHHLRPEEELGPVQRVLDEAGRLVCRHM